MDTGNRRAPPVGWLGTTCRPALRRSDGPRRAFFESDSCPLPREELGQLVPRPPRPSGRPVLDPRLVRLFRRAEVCRGKLGRSVGRPQLDRGRHLASGLARERERVDHAGRRRDLEVRVCVGDLLSVGHGLDETRRPAGTNLHGFDAEQVAGGRPPPGDQSQLCVSGQHPRGRSLDGMLAILTRCRGCCRCRRSCLDPSGRRWPGTPLRRTRVDDDVLAGRGKAAAPRAARAGSRGARASSPSTAAATSRTSPSKRS